MPIGRGAEFNGHVASCVDVNERYREAERQRLLAQVGLALDAEPGVRQRMERLAGMLVEALLADACTVSHITDAGLPVVLARAGTTDDITLDGPPEEPTLLDGTTMVLPLRARGELLGVLSMHRAPDGPPFEEGDLATATQIADRAGVALDNALLLAEERATARRLALLQEATADFSAANRPQRVAETAVAHGKRLLADHEFAVFELRDSHRLEPLPVPGQRYGHDRVDLSEHSPIADAVAHQSPTWLDRAEDWRGEYPVSPTACWPRTSAPAR